MNKKRTTGQVNIVVDDVPIIGIMVPTRIRRKSVLQLHEPHHNLPLRLCSFTPKDILWSKDKIVGLFWSGERWAESTFSFPHAIYNQCYNKKTTVIQRLNGMIGGEKCFNSVNWFNKWDVYSLLANSNLTRYVPETFMLDDVNLPELLRHFKLVYIKPFYGNQGDKVHRVELTENGDIHISLHSVAPRFIIRKTDNAKERLGKLLAEKTYIVQRGVHSSQLDHKHYDIRVLVQKDLRGEWTVSSVVSRVAHQHFFNTTLYDSIHDAEEIFARVYPRRHMKKSAIGLVKTLSIDAARALEPHIGLLGEISVDFLLDQDMKFWIIEINGKPQKSIYDDIKGFGDKAMIYRRPIEYAYYLSTH